MLQVHTPSTGLAFARQDRQYVGVPEQVTHRELHRVQCCASLVEKAPGEQMQLAGAGEVKTAFVAQDMHWPMAAPWQVKQFSSQLEVPAEHRSSLKGSDRRKKPTFIISGNDAET